MADFDYARAWREVAVPAYESLPANVRDLLLRVATETADLHQLPDCSMPWPTDSTLRDAFEKIPAEWLALGAHVINAMGHWYPGLPACTCGHSAHEHTGKIGDYANSCRMWYCECNQYQKPGTWPHVPGREAGAHWKFSHYADQSLRGRLGLVESGDHRYGNGWHSAVHEGVLRLCYSSRNMWTWVEVCPATVSMRDAAASTITRLRQAGSTIDRRCKHKIDSAVYTAVEKARKTGGIWPSDTWQRFARIVEDYSR